ncbi:MAG: MG2 domain-containing protein, partial [Anaerolineae bacterium]|nr:MG2 domain-containing protein [Anaerolineae bacterium]
NEQTGEAATGTFTWQDKGFSPPPDPSEAVYYDPVYNPAPDPVVYGVETVVFTPDEPLDLDTAYVLTLEAGQPAEQGSLGRPYKARFQTIPKLEIERTTIKDGDTDVPLYSGLEVTFSAPVDPLTFIHDKTILISPPVSSTEVYTSFWNNNTGFTLNFPTFQYSSTVTVTIRGEVESRYGQPLGKDTTIHWTTAPREPFVFLNNPEFVGTYTTLTETMAYVTVSGVQVVDFALYTLSPADFMALTGVNDWEVRERYRPDSGDLIREWQLDTPVPLNKGFVYGTNLSGKDGGHLEPGLYYLEVSAAADNVDPRVRRLGQVATTKQVLIVSDYNLTLKTGPSELFGWLTELDSTKPVSRAKIRFETEGKVLGSATTDQSGVAIARHERMPDLWVPRFAFSEEPFAVASSRWDKGIQRWDFEGVNVEDSYFTYNAFLYTERPLYRPGHTVHFKGVVRQDDDAAYSLPPEGSPVTITVSDPTGKEIYAEELHLSKNGTYDGQFVLDEEAALGQYYMYASYPDTADTYGIYGSARSFQVSEFRRPEFLVSVDTDRPEYINQDTIQLKAKAEFFFGGPVANAEVRDQILSADDLDQSTPRQTGIVEGGYEFTNYENSFTQRDSYFFGFGQLIDQGTGTTDANGEFLVEVSADIAARLASQRFTLEVSLIDPDSNLEVSARTEALVHQGAYYIGLRPQQYLGQAGQDTRIDLITVDWLSEPAPNQEVTVVFAEHNWYSVQTQNPDTGEFYWESVVDNLPVFTETVTTDAQGRAEVGFVPRQGGIYKITAAGEDSFGNTIQSAAYLWVSGSGYVNWRQNNHDRIDLVLDKKEYAVGDTASVLIAHPYSG